MNKSMHRDQTALFLQNKLMAVKMWNMHSSILMTGMLFTTDYNLTEL